MSLSVLALVVALAAPPGGEDADALVKRGIEMRRTGQDLEALELFKRANAASPSARALAQMGLAEQAIGRWPDAEADIGKALASPKDPWIAKNRAALEASLAAIGQHLGSLEVLGTPAGAEVVVDGRVVSKLPMPHALRVTAGTVPVEVRAAGYLPVARTVTVVSGQLTRESVTLQPVPSAGDVAQPPPAGSHPPGPLPPPPAHPQAAPSAASGAPLRTAAWVTLAAGAAFAVAGGVSLIVREVDATNYNNNCVDPAAPLDMSQQSQCHDWKGGGDTATKLAIGTFVTAGVLGATSAVLFYLSPARGTAEGNDKKLGLVCLPDAALRGASCALRF